MSYAVEEWVWQECHLSHDRLRLVLLAIARHCANDDGTGSYPSEARLARMLRINVKTLRSDVRRLEQAGELLVWRPDVAARGRSNRYAVVMGRDPGEVRRLIEEPRPRPREAAPTADKRQDRRHRPPASGPEPVQIRSSTGPASRSALDRKAEPRTTSRADAARCSDARAAPDPDSRLDALRAELGSLADEVSWQMTPEQTSATVALVAVHGPRRLAQVALDLSTERGRPTFARAWLGAWRQMPTAGADHGRVVAIVGEQRQPINLDEGRVSPARLAARASCTACDRHRGGAGMLEDDDGRPVRRCPTCHPAELLEAAF